MIKTSKVVNFFTITTGKQIQYQVVKKFIDIHNVANNKNLFEKMKQDRTRFSKIIVELLSILFWIYAIIKLFFFDIDIVLITKYLPEFTGFLYFKFFVIIGLISIIWSFTRNKQIVPYILYVAFYPGVILLWKIPSYIFKQKSWSLAFALINTLISFFKSIKYNFIISTLYLISFAIILNATNQKLLWIAMTIIFSLCFITYFNRFILVFKPSSEFQTYVNILSKFKTHGISTLSLDDSIRNLPIGSLNQKQTEKWTTNLQTLVLYNRICIFVGKKLKVYQNSGFNFVYYVMTVLMLIIITAFSFAAVNYGLFKVDNTYYSYTVTPSFFTFFYYSFNNILFNNIREIVPILPVSQIIYMTQTMFELFIVVIFVALLFSFRSQKQVFELDRIIKEIEHQGRDMEIFIKDEYKIDSINDAIVALDKLKAGLISFIYKISESIK